LGKGPGTREQGFGNYVGIFPVLCYIIKKKKKIIIAAVAALVALFISACFMASDSGEGGDFAGGDGGGHYSPAAPPSGEVGNGSQNRPSAGQLTCGEWSDIKNYGFYLNLFTGDDPDAEESQRRNNFFQFIDYFGFETRYMVTVNVVSGGQPMGDAAVELYDNSSQTKLFAAKTDMRGNAYLFPPYDLNGENITVKAKSGDSEESLTFVYDPENALQITLDDGAAAQPVLDLMFVIDTTGSMDDELRYLKTEISDVIGAISRDNPGYTINLALLFYRDTGDDYVTKYFDFTTDIAKQQANLSKQSANGGGDFPEAVDKTLAEAVAKNWSGGYATRLIFHVCDAPPHDTQENKTLYYNSIKTAAQKGIRIIPVASSGIDFATEYLLRQEAAMTGGTYIFLTDDSGIGNSHLEPTVGEYTVEYLNACMVRVVNEYLTGIETEPVPYYQEQP
jgi:hypothetical protein